MCGLVGCWESAASNKLAASFRNALNLIKHRGPDDSGTFNFSEKTSEFLMGSVRLAILDLSHMGHMPMNSADSRFYLSFNGEITNYLEIRTELQKYGYPFVSNGDTEVLLAAWQTWGMKALDRFEGMFAFAIFDSVKKTLTLARDPFGIKPLFFHSSQGKFYYGSEIQALLAFLGNDATIDQQVAFEYLHWGYYDSKEDTFFTQIKQLRPGHILSISLETGQIIKHERYWWPKVESTSTLSLDQAADVLRDLFLTSVRNNLRTDVPFGVALSGGFDSSAIACAVRYLEPDIDLHTFSFVVPGYSRSEQRWAELVNDSVSAIPHYVTPGIGDLRNDIDEMIMTQGEPFISPSIYAQFRVFAAAKTAGITVTLDGQGADEAFAGYDGYPLQRVLSLLDEKQFSSALELIKKWGEWPGRDSRLLLTSVAAAKVPTWFKNIIRKSFSLGELYSHIGLVEAGVNVVPPGLSIEHPAFQTRLKQKMREQLTITGLPALLRHGDRNSMHFSIESRVPFLDRRMIEFTLSLPEPYLLSQSGETKYVLRKAMSGIVPSEVINRKDKIGYETPENEWLEPYLAAHAKTLLSAVSSFSFLNYAGVVKALTPNSSKPRLQWRLINLLRWSQLLTRGQF